MVDVYKKCVKEFGEECYFCESSDDNIIVHYVNGDRNDTRIKNLKPACTNCYAQIHANNSNLIEWSLKLENPPVEDINESQIISKIENYDYPGLPVDVLKNNMEINDDSQIKSVTEKSEKISVQDVHKYNEILYSVKSSRSSENIMLFPDRKEIVANEPHKSTSKSLSRVSHMEDMNDKSAIYKISKEDVWNSPFDEFEKYIQELNSVVGDITPRLESRISKYWERSNMFTLKTDDKGYSILVARDSEIFENIAKRKLEHNEHYTKFISDTSLRVTNGADAKVKQKLYNEGYLVNDKRDLEDGNELNISLDDDISLRDYQKDWVDKFMNRRSGTFVGPSGSGKTIATLGVLSELNSEALIIVTKRELAQQWQDEILEKTNISKRKIGQYHGGKKQIRPITIATYDTARQSRHRNLFNDRDWGLLVTDEAHHVTAPVWKRVANIQSKSRLGLTATPVRESGNSEEIYSLIGPPVGTDWHALFDEGYVQKPSVLIENVDWASDNHRKKYQNSKGHNSRQIAAMNPEKIKRLKEIIENNSDKNIVIFVEWIKQGKEYSEELDIPFICGETPHNEREEIFESMRDNELNRLIMSRVGDEGIDIPNADVCIICSTLGSSSAQTAQRIGRTMRPVGASKGILLATKGSNEEDFIQSSTQYLAEQGIEVEIK